MFLNNSEKRIACRVSDALDAEVRAIAQRDNNGISATVRRLLTAAIAREREQTTARS